MFEADSHGNDGVAPNGEDHPQSSDEQSSISVDLSGGIVDGAAQLDALRAHKNNRSLSPNVGHVELLTPWKP